MNRAKPFPVAKFKRIAAAPQKKFTLSRLSNLSRCTPILHQSREAEPFYATPPLSATIA